MRGFSDLPQGFATASANRSRGTSPIELVVLHSEPAPAGQVLALYQQNPFRAPHYYVDAEGGVTSLVPEDRVAQHSGQALWRRRWRNISPISIGVTLEHTPGAPYPPLLLVALDRLFSNLRQRYDLDEHALVRWEAQVQGEEPGKGVLIPVVLAPLPLLVAPPEPPSFTLSPDGSVTDPQVHCVPPPLPPEFFEPPPVSFTLGAELSPEAEQRLCSLLLQETYRHRGEGFRSDWSFHQQAASRNLGAPLCTSARESEQVVFSGKRYGFQVFAGDTLFNEIPKWSEVRSLNETLGGTIPRQGLGRLLLEASYKACNNPLNEQYAFHQLAVRERLGPALGGNYRATIGTQQVAVQVFVRDTLYTPIAVPQEKTNWGDVRRLSDLRETPGALRDGLWVETYKPCGAACDHNAPFQQFALRERLGTPLTAMYQVEFEGGRYSVQVFTGDTLYSVGNTPRRLSELVKARGIAAFKVTPVSSPPANPQDDKRRPVFTMLPLPLDVGPKMMQFYGLTRFARNNASRFYSATQGLHSGIDIYAPVGSRLVAIDHGVVFCAGVPGRDCKWGGAPPLVIVVRYGNVYAVYGHASAVHVRAGQVVRPGDLLGLSGTFNGPHLHFEVRPVSNPSAALNPLEFFSPELRSSFFEPQLGGLGGIGHFCRGTLTEQPQTHFGQPINTHPCER